ncbi:MAG: hypothetical protein U1E16_07190 [Hyphomicrobiales bacterium]|uniref:hypothetical protein n=1 Tax=Aestuariivirga sp. TaxID=2650926 RepID=UPI0035B1428A
MASLLELRFETETRRGAELLLTRADTMAALERTSTAGLVFYAAGLRRLAEIDGAIAASEQSRREIAKRLLGVRRRQEGLMRRARTYQEKGERKAEEDEALEVALAMADKATGKNDVVK